MGVRVLEAEGQLNGDLGAFQGYWPYWCGIKITRKSGCAYLQQGMLDIKATSENYQKVRATVSMISMQDPSPVLLFRIHV